MVECERMLVVNFENHFCGLRRRVCGGRNVFWYEDLCIMDHKGEIRG